MKTRASHPIQHHEHPALLRPGGSRVRRAFAFSPAERRQRKFLTVRLVPLTALLVALSSTAMAQFNYQIHDGTVTITSYTWPMGGAVFIPDTIFSLPVARIGDWAFRGRTDVTSVRIPESVTSIGNGAFSGCTGLASITIHDNVISIGNGAFSGCAGLTSIVIPNSVASIDDWAFSGCSGLTGVSIPESVIHIGKMAFSDCTRLVSIEVNDLNPAYRSLDGVLFDSTQDVLIQFPGGKAGFYAVPEGVTSIGYGAFAFCASLTSVRIPDGVTSIGDRTFEYCSALTSARIPDSVGNIGKNAFNRCSSLTSITIPDSVTGELSCIFDCTSLLSAIIGKGITRLAVYELGECPNLKSVYFRGSRPNLGSEVFSGSENVIVYYLPEAPGWGYTYGSRPARLWNPLLYARVQAGALQLAVTGTTAIPILVEAGSDLHSTEWVPLYSGALTGGSVGISDPQWAEHSTRLYRVRSPE